MEGIVVLVAALAVNVATSLIKNVNMTSKQKGMVALVTSALAGAASTFVNGDFNTGDFAQTAVLVFGASQAIYAFILKGTPADFVLLKAFNGTKVNIKAVGNLVKAVEDVATETAKATKKVSTKKKAPAKK